MTKSLDPKAFLVLHLERPLKLASARPFTRERSLTPKPCQRPPFRPERPLKLAAAPSHVSAP